MVFYYFTIDIRPAYANWTAFDLVIRSEEIKQTISELDELLFFLLFLHTGIHVTLCTYVVKSVLCRKVVIYVYKI